MKIEQNQNGILSLLWKAGMMVTIKLCRAEKKDISQLCREELECVELLERLREKLEEGADNLQLLLDAADR